MLEATSKILYLRAGLKPLARHIKAAGGIAEFLHQQIVFDELLVPKFRGARPFWRDVAKHAMRKSNSGPLGKLIGSLPGAVTSEHPSHPFAGYGEKVSEILKLHNYHSACFEPIIMLAEKYDFSMLLLGCLDESPGFSTVHATQHQLGLSQKHLIRLLLRWDDTKNGAVRSRIAPESPGCSLSFDKFYHHYEEDNNLIRGEWFGVPWIFITSARRALSTEMKLLKANGRFVDCGRLTCDTCRLRLY
jgi:hypothetical protein